MKIVLLCLFFFSSVFCSCVDDVCYWDKQESIIEFSDLVDWKSSLSNSFFISSTEITVSQYKACVNDEICSEDDINMKYSTYSKNMDTFPINFISWDGCHNVCNWAGGRLCKESEWVSACKQESRYSYPYGDSFIPDLCNIGTSSQKSEIAEPGSYRGCEGGISGVYDMLGNLGEWLDEGKEDYRKFRASSYMCNGPVSLDCGKRCGGNQRSFTAPTIGCRCCKSIE